MASANSPSLLNAQAAELSFSLIHTAGTYTVGTVSNGDILIKSVTAYVSTAAVGVTSAALQTDNTTADTLLATTLLATLTGGKNLTPFTTSIVLPSGGLIQGVIVGTGTAGVLKVVVEYYPLTAGATIS